MLLPVIYADDVGLLFGSALVAFAVYWGIFKAISLIR